MNAKPLRLPLDDEPQIMTAEQRSVWIYLAATVLATVAYAAIVVPRALDNPVAEVSWVRPMLLAIGGTILLTIVGTIVWSIAAGARLGLRGRDPEIELESDVRDKEINKRGTTASSTLVGVGLLGVLILTMAGADHFWIGQALYVTGAAGGITEAITKLRLYQRGF
jgi:peptidoglycan/LPS O-acetylase OafA/YrhL